MQRVKLGDVVNHIKEKIDKDNTNLEFYIGGEHIDDHRMVINKKGIIKGSTIGPAFHMHFMPNDVLLMSRNPHLCKASMVTFEGICSDVSYVIRTKDEKIFTQRLLPFIVQTNAFWRFAEEHKRGGMPFFLNWKDFAEFEFNLPSIEEQEEISNILWAAEKLKEAYERQLILSDELVKSRFIEMFDKYDKVDLSTLADITMGQSPDSKSYNNDGNGMPFFQGKGDYGDKVAKVAHWTTAPSKVVDANVVLMSVRAPVGPVNFSPIRCCIGRGLCGINAKEGKTNNEFLYNALSVMQDEIAGKGVGSTFAAITKKDVYEIKIPNAPIELCDEFSSFAEQIDKSKFVLQESINKMEKIIKTISEMTFS